MAHKAQAVEAKQNKKDRSKKPGEAQRLRPNDQAKGLEPVSSEAMDTSQLGPILASQANPLADARMPVVQRQLLAGQFGQLLGNQSLQRLIPSSQPVTGTIQRDDGDGDAGTTDAGAGDAGTTDAGEAPANNLSHLNEILDQFNVPEDEVINLLGQLDATDKATVIDPRNGYKEKIASALNTDEMTQALTNLQPPLTTKLEWMAAAAGGARSLDYAQIQPMITAAPGEASTLTGWRDFFVDVCNNETIMTAVRDLGFSLATQLDWIRAEVFSARLELNYADLSGLITAATQIDRDALKTNEWKSFFVEVCTNETMQQAVVDLGWEPATKLEWLIAEGVDIEDTILTEVTGLSDSYRTGILANTTVMNYLRAHMDAVEFWRIQLILTYGDQASIPGPLVSIYGVLSSNPSSEEARRTFRDFTPADLDMLKTAVGLHEVLQATLSAEDVDFITHLIETGIISQQAGVTRNLSESLLVPNAGGTNYVERPFGGTGGFDVAYHTDRLQVTVRIKLAPMDATATAQLPAAQPVWESRIENAWNGFNISNDDRTIPMNFDCVFTDSNPHHTVTVHPNNPVGWPSVDMTNWWTGSLGSPSHEFGHMLGNPDEYYLSSEHFAVVTGQNPATAPAGTVTSETLGGTTRYSSNASIMGFSGSVEPRHLQFFIDWLNQNRMKNDDNTFAEPEFRLGS